MLNMKLLAVVTIPYIYHVVLVLIGSYVFTIKSRGDRCLCGITCK